MRSVVLMGGMLVVALLAGCQDGPKGGDVPARLIPEAQELGLQATKDTGVIVGVVVDTGYAPVAGALVELGEGSPLVGLKNTTNERGAFGFATLPAGVYVLKVSKAGHNATTLAVEVVAGVASPKAAKVILPRNPAMDPYVDYRSGYLFITGGQVGPVAVRAPAATGNASTMVRWDITPGTDVLQGELYWEPTTPLGERVYFYCGVYPQENPDRYQALGVTSGSPAVVRFEIESDANDMAYCGVWPTGVGAGAVVEQPFQVYTSMFYRMAPMDSWTLGEDGPHPLPA